MTIGVGAALNVTIVKGPASGCRQVAAGAAQRRGRQVSVSQSMRNSIISVLTQCESDFILDVLLFPEEGWARSASSSYWTLQPSWWRRERCKVVEVAGTRRSVHAGRAGLLYWTLQPSWWRRERCKVVEVAGTRRSVHAGRAGLLLPDPAAELVAPQALQGRRGRRHQEVSTPVEGHLK
ncbi:unnamed protein product [Plutella xylostella]|uniref:(diamondback moth) hypothetical protein n=1 Tax=Plutella xylostella TaxID=51655 RepID=A0A8S4E886_PLUXY|nr:unnamed protein product [Plutella xylostella]